MDLEEISGNPLTENERKQVRRLLREEQNAAYFWRTLRIWGAWGTSAIGAVYIAWDTILKYAQAIFKTMTGSGH